LPSEDDGDENTERNPLSGINLLGPQPLRQMVEQTNDPANDLNGLDPNTGVPGFILTKDDQQHIGSTAPALEVLDTNNGSNPLTQLHIDPNQVHTRSEKENVVDPNTGQKPLPLPKG
jgi:hypothetical protein